MGFRKIACFLFMIFLSGAVFSASDPVKPFPPFRIAGNLYYVGNDFAANYLIVTPKGNILINSNDEASVPMIKAIEDDVWRRDFTVNALYYNIADFSVVDYMGGMQDIQNRVLRIIGDPEQRFQEDPVRLLRAVRFLGKLNITADSKTEKSLMELSHLLQHVSPARLFQEVLKLFQEGATAVTFQLLQKYRLFEQLFPQTAEHLTEPLTQKLLDEALTGTDQRAQEGKTVSPAFLLAVFLWRPVQQRTLQVMQMDNISAYAALEKALQHVLHAQTRQLAIPRVLLVAIREICMLQHNFTQRHGSRPYRSLEHPRFRAAYDLLLLRAKSGEPIAEIAEWWTAFHLGDGEEREKLLKNGSRPTHKRKRPRRFRKKKPEVKS